MPDDEHLIRNLPNSPKAFDTALLPPEAGRRLQILRDAHRDSTAMVGGLGFRQIQLNDTRQSVSANLRVLQVHRAADDHPEMVRLNAMLRDIDEERARLDERINAHHAATAPRGDLLRAVEDWLRTNSARYGFKQATVQATPKKGETVGAAVERLRFRIRELDAERNRVESAIYPLATAVQAAKDAVEARARPPVTSSCLEFAGPLIIAGKLVEQAVEFPKLEVTEKVVTAQGQGAVTVKIDDVVGFLCWAMPDVILSRITEDLKLDADDANALDANQRRSTLATIAKDRLMIEAEECELLFQSLAAGVVIEARRDCDPGAFLGLTLTDKPAEPVADDAMSRARQAQGKSQPINPDAIRFEGRA